MQVKGNLSVVQDLFADQGFIEFDKTGAIENPPSGSIRLYLKSDEEESEIDLYLVRSDGTEDQVGAGAAGASGVSLQQTIIQSAHGLELGKVLYYDGSETKWKKACADDYTTFGRGVVVSVYDEDTFNLCIAGYTDVMSGLINGYNYYTSDVISGELTAIEPSFSNPILQAGLSGAAWIYPYRPAESGAGNTISEQTFTSISGQVDYTINVYPTSEQYMWVWVGAVIQEPYTAYNLAGAGNTVRLATAPMAGTTVRVRSVVSSVFEENTDIVDNQFTSTTGQTNFTLSRRPSEKHHVWVWAGNVIQSQSQYTLEGSTIIFPIAPPAGTVIRIKALIATELTTGLDNHIDRNQYTLETPLSGSIYTAHLGTDSSVFEIWDEQNPKIHADVYFAAGDDDPDIITYTSGNVFNNAQSNSGTVNIYVVSGELVLENQTALERTFTVYRKL